MVLGTPGAASGHAGDDCDDDIGSQWADESIGTAAVDQPCPSPEGGEENVLASTGALGLSTMLRSIDSVGERANEISLTMVLKNFSDDVIADAQVFYDLVATFGPNAASIADVRTTGPCVAAEPTTDARADDVVALLGPGNSLNAGEECGIELTVTVGSQSSGPFTASAVATGVVNDVLVSDISTDGASPDANGNGTPADDSVATIIYTTAPPQAELLGASVVNEQFEGSVISADGPAGMTGPNSTIRYITLAVLAVGLFAGIRRGLGMLADRSN